MVSLYMDPVVNYSLRYHHFQYERDVDDFLRRTAHGSSSSRDRRDRDHSRDRDHHRERPRSRDRDRDRHRDRRHDRRWVRGVCHV